MKQKLLNIRFALITLVFFLVYSPSVLGRNVVQAQNYSSSPEEISIPVKTQDKRIYMLDRYLARFNSPLQPHAKDFVEAADKYQLDWKLVPAIAGVESTFGKHIPGGYNAWGWGVYGTQAIYFESWRDGIFAVSEGLKTNYIDKGLTNPYQINRIYAASKAWGGNVSFFLKDLEQFEALMGGKYELETSSADTKVQEAGASAKI